HEPPGFLVQPDPILGEDACRSSLPGRLQFGRTLRSAPVQIDGDGHDNERGSKRQLQHHSKRHTDWHRETSSFVLPIRDASYLKIMSSASFTCRSSSAPRTASA